MYIFFNPNNRNKAAGDCVIRAICAAEGKDWDTVYDELCFEGKYGGDWGSNNDIWDNYLRKNGYKRGLVPTACPTCYTIEDFAREYNRGTYIVATGSHVVAVINGNYWDSYDSGQKMPIYYYYKEGK